jgi:hypothetical protein
MSQTELFRDRAWAEGPSLTEAMVELYTGVACELCFRDGAPLAGRGRGGT